MSNYISKQIGTTQLGVLVGTTHLGNLGQTAIVNLVYITSLDKREPRV